MGNPPNQLLENTFMSSTSLQEKYLNTAIKAVKAASLICKEIQAQLVGEDSITKKDKSPVTIADYASQAINVYFSQ